MTAGEAGGPDDGSGASRLGRLREAYASTAVVLLNFVVLVLALNVVLGAGYAVRGWISGGGDGAGEEGRLFREDGAPVRTPKRTGEMMAWFDFGAFEDVPAEAAGRMLDDFYELEQLGFAYQPWVQFSEPPFDGERVHVDVDSMGFPVRRTTGGPGRGAERTVRIFALGGSTTFGYWVADEHTWPSHLSEILNRRADEQGLPLDVDVVNYGRGYYYPTQESVLLRDLLRSGHRPSLVIFMDGVNWGGPGDVPHFNPEAANAFSARQHGAEVTEADFVRELDWIPLVRAVWSARLWLAGARGPAGGGGGGPAVTEEQRFQWAEYAVHRFRQSRRLSRATCELYGCETMFVLQPNAYYGYDLDLYRRELPESFMTHIEPTEQFYDRMREDSEYVDLSQLFAEWGPDRKAIVDYVHYSPGFGRLLAEELASRIDLDELPVRPGGPGGTPVTGEARSIVRKGEWLKPESGWSGHLR